MSWCSLHGRNDSCDKESCLEMELSLLRARLALAEKVVEAANTLRTFQTLQYVTGRTDDEISERIKILDAALHEWEDDSPPPANERRKG